MFTTMRPLTAVRRAARWVAPVVPLVLLGMVTACSGGTGTAGVPRGGSAPSATASGGAFEQALAFSRCMRAHGVSNFPDPQHAGGGTRVTIGGGVNPNSPQFQEAEQACRALQPGGTTASGGAAVDPTKIGPWTACMRSHGVPNLPDPQNAGSALRLNLAGTGIDPENPALRSAQQACQSLYPGGGMLITGGGGS